MKKILVTGGAGFIGSHTVDSLLENNYHVTVYDNFTSGKLTNLNVFHPNIKIIQGDILDTTLLMKEIKCCDAVLHLAALPSVPKSIEDPIQSLKINTMGFVQLLQVIRECNPQIRLVYASSAAVYGNASQLPCDDAIPLSGNCLSPYALEKFNNEHYAKLFANLFGIKSLGLRYFNVYGERQDPTSPYSGVISKFISRHKAGELITVFGDGKQSRDFISVKDVARANRLALQNDYCGTLNIATGVPETLLNLIRYLGIEDIKLEFASARAGDIRESYARVEQAKACLDFYYAIPAEVGIRELI